VNGAAEDYRDRTRYSGSDTSRLTKKEPAEYGIAFAVEVGDFDVDVPGDIPHSSIPIFIFCG
jgi:hypothetical protein